MRRSYKQRNWFVMLKAESVVCLIKNYSARCKTEVTHNIFNSFSRSAALVSIYVGVQSELNRLCFHLVWRRGLQWGDCCLISHTCWSFSSSPELSVGREKSPCLMSVLKSKQPLALLVLMHNNTNLVKSNDSRQEPQKQLYISILTDASHVYLVLHDVRFQQVHLLL